MNRSSLNQKARKKIAAIAMDLNLNRCEVRLPGCMSTFGIAPAHRHKRVWYYDKPDEMLWDYNQWVAACQFCHHQMEADKELTGQVFERLRQNEKTHD